MRADPVTGRGSQAPKFTKTQPGLSPYTGLRPCHHSGRDRLCVVFQKWFSHLYNAKFPTSISPWGGQAQSPPHKALSHTEIGSLDVFASFSSEGSGLGGKPKWDLG